MLARLVIDPMTCPGLLFHFRSNRKDENDCRIWIDLNEARCTLHSENGYFQYLNAQVNRLENGYVDCTAAILTDYAPLLRCDIVMQENFSAQIEPRMANLEIRTAEVILWHEDNWGNLLRRGK